MVLPTPKKITSRLPRNLTSFRSRKNELSAEDVAARGYNLDLKNPHTPDAKSHDPDELLARYAEQQTGIQSIRNQLKAILSDALGGKA